MSRVQQPRQFTGEGFFEDSYAPLPAGVNAKKISVSDRLKATRASTDSLLNRIDTTLNGSNTLSYESPPDKPRRPERYNRTEEMPISLRIMTIVAIDSAAGQVIDLEPDE